MEATAEKKVVGARKPTRLVSAEHTRHVWLVTVPPDISFEQTHQPDFWAHVGAQLRPGARIEVMPEDMSWFGELMVLECDRLWAKVAPLRFVELAGVNPDKGQSLAAGYRVEYKGPTKKHCVLRTSDNTIVQEGIALKVDAEAWIREHVQVLAR